MTETAETTVRITVFFDEDMPEEQILAVGDDIRGWEEVQEARCISTARTWESFRAEYFEGMKELAEGFTNDNLLSGSTSYEIFLNDIEEQGKIVERLESMEGVREMRYSSTAVAGLTNAGKMIGAIPAAIICVLLAMAVFLISNTISTAVTLRRRENEIMYLIGATNYMIRMPSVMESMFLGALGAVVPLTSMYVLYQRTVIYIGEHYRVLTGMSGPILLRDMFPYMTVMAGCLGAGTGFFVGYFTIHHRLKVQGKRM